MRAVLHNAERFQKDARHPSILEVAEAQHLSHHDFALELLALRQQLGTERKATLIRATAPFVLHGADVNFFQFEAGFPDPLLDPILEITFVCSGYHLVADHSHEATLPCMGKCATGYPYSQAGSGEYLTKRDEDEGT
jgi:hypothetical protein